MTVGALAASLAMAVGGVAVASHDDGGEVNTATGILPDIVEEVPHHLNIQNTKHREWLRFSTTHINIGAGNLQIRGGGQVAPCEIEGVSYAECTVATQEILDADGDIVATHPAGEAVFHPEHNHWHQEAVAEFAIRASLDLDDEEPLSIGTKVTFCLVDVKFTGGIGSLKKQEPRTYWECNGDLQGIASGWADSYHQSTAGQELEVTGLPHGVYYLTHMADPENHWVESDETNNFTWVRFRLDRGSGANPSVTVLETSECNPLIICGFGGNP